MHTYGSFCGHSPVKHNTFKEYRTFVKYIALSNMHPRTCVCVHVCFRVNCL
uniref:Uncharacterized protein n=1 Tax=Anguilla anguilla TaxID=7936 RepID=A0A0E9PZW7_ANGAN